MAHSTPGSNMLRKARLAVSLAVVTAPLLFSPFAMADPPSSLDARLRARLDQVGFKGAVGSLIDQRLARLIDPRPANLGRLLFFDRAGGLHNDNTFGGGHSPANGFGDSQSIAIGVQNNNRVGPKRSGPRNQRRTPTLLQELSR